MPTQNTSLSLSISNPNGEPIVYSGEPPITLTFKLINQTGNDFKFQTGADASVFEIFFTQSFQLSDLQKMNIVLTGWTFSVSEAGPSLKLVYNGGGTPNWSNGEVLNIDVTGVQTASQPGTDSAQVNFTPEKSGKTLQVTAPLSVLKKPVKGNGDLTKVLQVSLDNQGGVIVSPTDDPLQNTIFLNIKNISDTPLYNGTDMWKGNPTVTVLFIYGTNVGSLAPDDKTDSGPGSGSAWNIVASISSAPPENIWDTDNPDKTKTDPHPVWTLEPSNLNKGIIGTGQNANITFDFSYIISFTPPGHTQMYVQFSGFMKDEKTPFDDALFVLDIAKQNAPPTRGIINFFSPKPIYTVNEPTTPIVIPLRWAMFDVDNIILLTNFPDINPFNKDYPHPKPVDYDSTEITIPGTTQSVSITFTLQAYNGNGGFLNSTQFTVYIQANMFVDPRDGKVYKVVKINSRIWMSENLDYVPRSGSKVLGPKKDYGRLYQFDFAAPKPYGAWRLPNKTDWMDLINNFTYEQLISGGSGLNCTGLNALLGGMIDSRGVTSNFNTRGFYWTGDTENDNGDYVSFSSVSNTVSYIDATTNNPFSILNFINVRYVKDVS